MPFVRLHWLSGQRTLETIQDVSAIRIPIKRDGHMHRFHLVGPEDDPEGFSIFEETRATDDRLNDPIRPLNRSVGRFQRAEAS